MATFRKKPIVIEAEQWFPGKEIEGVITRSTNPFAEINTLEGVMVVSKGDWIITGVEGEKYPCKPSIFEKTYEPVMKEFKSAKDMAYWERNQLVAYLSRLFEAWIEKHPEEDKEWESDWRNIVFIKFSQGVYSWHIHDSELGYFEHLQFREGNSWDGSTTEQKYEALRKEQSWKISRELSEKLLQEWNEYMMK